MRLESEISSSLAQFVFGSPNVQMLDATTVGVFSGFGIFLLGVHGFRYMQARVAGGWNRVRIVRGLVGKYRDMIREGIAPLWPLVLCGMCIPIGIAVVFASIFLGPQAPVK